MIPILFAPKSREYNNNGLGVLVDVGYCTVTEERNGAFELELQYPVNGRHYADLSVDCQILAKPNETSDPQSFRVYNISKPMNGVVKVKAEHISYQLSSIIVSPFSATNAADALSKIKANSITENPFEFWTDKSTEANMSHNIPLSARSLLGGVSGSILETYTGEYEFDNYTVKLHQNRGSDNGVVIAYAKNLTGVKCEERSDNVVTGAIAVWIVKDENEQVINEVYGDLQTVDTELSYSRNVVIDCSDDFEVEPTKDDLNAKAMQYIQSHKNTPYFSVAVEFVNLGDTEEYKQYKDLYRVNLCDIVTVKHPLYGINVKSKVVKTVFDSVREKYEKIEIGEVSANISKTIAAQEKEIAQKVDFSELGKAVANATSSIAGNKGGYVVLYPSAVQPQELLILDKPNIGDASNVWRWNLSGLGHSSNGYNGDFTTAITADGQIVADFITTGTLNASLLNVINLSADSINTGILSSKDGKTFLDLNSGELQMHSNGIFATIGSSDNSAAFVLRENKIGDLFAFYSPTSDSVWVANGGAVITSPRSYVETGILFRDYELSFLGRFNGFTSGMSINPAQREVSLFARDLNGATLDLYGNNVKIDSTNSVDISSVKNFNVSAETICLGSPYTSASGYNLLISKSTFIDSDVFVNDTITALDVIDRSERKIKKNIQKSNTKNALSTVKKLNIYDYDLIKSGKNVKMGLMADEAPVEIVREEGISLYSYCGLLAMAIKELSEKVEQIDKNGGNYGRKD
jgi:phage minor structural protein